MMYKDVFLIFLLIHIFESGFNHLSNESRKKKDLIFKNIE